MTASAYGRCLLWLPLILAWLATAALAAESPSPVSPTAQPARPPLAAAGLTPAALSNTASAQAPGPSPAMAATLALFPGLLAHGTGHFYAGRPLTGVALVAMELGSLYLMYRGGEEIAAGRSTLAEDSPGFGDTGQLSRGLGLAAGGLVIFLGSWLYDVTGAPLAAGETAAERAKAAQPAAALKPEVRGGSVGVAWEQRF